MKRKITFIGAGKIAHSLVPALIENDYQVLQILSASLTSAKNLADKNSVSLYSDNLKELSEETDIIFLAIPDDKLEPVAKELSGLTINFQEKLIIHLSGVKNVSSLKPLKNIGAATAGIHIMQTFPAKNKISLANSYAALESEDKNVLEVLRKLTSALGLIYFEISPEQKIYYHLMGVFASNFLVSNFIAVEKLSELTGLEKKFAIEILDPLIQTTLNNIKSNGAAKSLSGVIARRDFESVKTHTEALRHEPAILQSYLSLQLNLIESELNFSREDGELIKIKDYLQKKLKEQN